MENLKYYASFLNYGLLKLYLNGRSNHSHDLGNHLDAAAQWMCRAQDTFNDGGVARGYCLVYNTYFQKKGWISSYPETTGYIIPTMFDYAHLTGNPKIFDRAVKMADWEFDVQLKNGAVQGGVIGQKPSPAIFNTGQVVFGWLRAYQETRREKYLQAAVKAGTFLADMQETDGTWKKSLSAFTSDQMPFYAYNTRTAWALCLLSSFPGQMRFRSPGIRNIEFILAHQLNNGWFPNNCLTDPESPLLHTIAYCIRGILEVGLMEENDTYVARAKKAADALLDRQRSDGVLPGRFDKEWAPTVPWRCLTGNAQMAIIWGKLYQLTREPAYFRHMQETNRYLMKCQLLNTSNADIRGGISGSDPLSGQYGRFEILNWAVKFFMDSLMLEMGIQRDLDFRVDQGGRCDA